MIKLVAVLLIALATTNAGCGWRDAISCGKTVHKVFKKCYNGNMEDFSVVGCAKNTLAIYKDDNCFDCFCSLIPVVGKACEMFELNKLNEGQNGEIAQDGELSQGRQNRALLQEEDDTELELELGFDGEDGEDDGEEVARLTQGWQSRGFQDSLY